MNKVLTTKNELLTKPCKQVTLEEGLVVATQLLEILNKRKDAVG